MSHPLKRKILSYLGNLLDLLSGRAGSTGPSPPLSSEDGPTRFKAGDWVRVRSKEEIRATLNHWRQLKGCGFMEEMEPYCGTTQRILKPVRRFLDERDYGIKKCKGVYLLEGLICEGTKRFGPCDRSCYYFWRREWLTPAKETDLRQAADGSPSDR